VPWSCPTTPLIVSLSHAIVASALGLVHFDHVPVSKDIDR
jgi:hypothetical protein